MDVFSILFHKTFIIWGNNQRGMTRFVSLLQLFNLRSRLINSLEGFLINKERKIAKAYQLFYHKHRTVNLPKTGRLFFKKCIIISIKSEYHDLQT